MPSTELARLAPVIMEPASAPAPPLVQTTITKPTARVEAPVKTTPWLVPAWRNRQTSLALWKWCAACSWRHWPHKRHLWCLLLFRRINGQKWSNAWRQRQKLLVRSRSQQARATRPVRQQWHCPQSRRRLLQVLSLLCQLRESRQCARHRRGHRVILRHLSQRRLYWLALARWRPLRVRKHL